MLDFTMLAKAMDLKREKDKSKSVNAQEFLNNIDNIYGSFVEATFCSGATELLDSIEELHKSCDFEEISIPITAMEMLDTEE